MNTPEVQDLLAHSGVYREKKDEKKDENEKYNTTAVDEADKTEVIDCDFESFVGIFSPTTVGLWKDFEVNDETRAFRDNLQAKGVLKSAGLTC